MLPTLPDHTGGSIANLICEVEGRLGGRPPLSGLHDRLARLVPDAETYVVVVFDGLGSHQLDPGRTPALSGDRVADLDACFPTTTVVGMSTLATGLAPAGHGIVSHFLRLEDHGVVNALKWRDRSGAPVAIDTSRLLPETVWERLSGAGVESVTVQPGAFDGTPTSRLLYRGARFEPVWSATEWVDATVAIASTPRRLVFAYWPGVDMAAHIAGQASDTYAAALAEADALWSGLGARLPRGTVAIATADHGHVDYPSSAKAPFPRGGAAFGDPRALLLDTDGDRAAELARDLPVRVVVDPVRLLGPGQHPALETRMPSHALLADRGHLVLPGYMDDRLVGYHGGLEPEEVTVPLVVTAH